MRYLPSLLAAAALAAVSFSLPVSAKTANVAAIQAKMAKVDVCSVSYRTLANQLPPAERTKALDKTVTAKCPPPADRVAKGGPVYKVPSPPPVVEAPPVQYMNVCGGKGLFGRGLFGYGTSVTAYSGWSGGAKDMNDESTGVDKSVIGFNGPTIGAELCVGVSPNLSVDLSVDHMFGISSTTRNYPSGWSETDKLSALTTLRLGPTWHINRQWALGAHGLVSWGKMDWQQDLDWFGTHYHNEGTANGTFAGLGASLRYNVTDNWNLRGVVDYGKMVSSPPAGTEKTQYIRGMLAVGYTF